MMSQRMRLQSGNENSKPWLNENFADRFRQAFGREMTAEERSFFGLESPRTETEETEGAD